MKTKHQGTFDVRFIRARDGDTVEVLVSLPFGVFLQLPIRLVGIESHEPSGETLPLAKQIAEKIERRWSGVMMRLAPAGMGRDKYGRIRGDLWTPEGLLSDWLVAQKLAWRVDPRTGEPTPENEEQCTPLEEISL